MPASRGAGKQQSAWPQQGRARSLGRLKLAISHDRDQKMVLKKRGDSPENSSPSQHGTHKACQDGGAEGSDEGDCRPGSTVIVSEVFQTRVTLHHASLFPLLLFFPSPITKRESRGPLPTRNTTPSLNPPTGHQPTLRNQTITQTQKEREIQKQNSPIHHHPPPPHQILIQVRNHPAEDADRRRAHHAAQEAQKQKHAPLALPHQRLAQAGEHEEERTAQENRATA